MNSTMKPELSYKENIALLKERLRKHPEKYYADEGIFTTVLKMLYPKPRGSVLDVGAGEGVLTHHIRQAGFAVEACDINPSEMKFNIRCKKVDVNKEKLPYGRNAFDYVICTEVIEHLENPWQLTREISRVLKKGGILILSTPHLISLIQRVYFFFTGHFLHFKRPFPQGGHITPVSLHILNELLHRVGLKITNITYDRGWLPLLRITLPRWAWCGYSLIVEAQKIK